MHASDTITACRPETTLEVLTGHVDTAICRIIDITNNLRAHADRLHGATPENGCAGAPRAEACGAISHLDERLVTLAICINELQEQAIRNTNLA